MLIEAGRKSSMAGLAGGGGGTVATDGGCVGCTIGTGVGVGFGVEVGLGVGVGVGAGVCVGVLVGFASGAGVAAAGVPQAANPLNVAIQIMTTNRCRGFFIEKVDSKDLVGNMGVPPGRKIDIGRKREIGI